MIKSTQTFEVELPLVDTLPDMIIGGVNVPFFHLMENSELRPAVIACRRAMVKMVKKSPTPGHVGECDLRITNAAVKRSGDMLISGKATWVTERTDYIPAFAMLFGKGEVSSEEVY